MEGTIGRWLKREGDRVERFEPVVEVVTDKVNVDVPSPAAGTLLKIVAPVGATVPVGAVLAELEPTAPEGMAGDAKAPAAATRTIPVPQETEQAAIEARTGEAQVSPLVMKLATEHNVDLGQVRGTGEGGRVRKQDVLDFVAQRQARGISPGAVSPASATTAQMARRPPLPVKAPGDVEVPVSPVRATIARRMSRSMQEIPHAWTTFEVDVEGLVALRNLHKETFRARQGIALTYLPFFIQAAAGALKEVPQVNAVWAEDRIILRKEINIGVAVDRNDGLIVPVVRRSDEKSIAAIAKELDDLIARAKENRLTIDDVQGGTFTISNAGSFGTMLSMSIINQPQVAIVSTEGITQRPAIYKGAVVPRWHMNISIAFNHRALDGGTIGRFMQSLKHRLEAYNPATAIE